MRSYLVIGTGGIGLYLGSLLQRRGNVAVHFLARSDYNHMLNDGIKINSCDGDFVLHANDIKVYNKIDDIPPCDVVLLAVKGNNIINILPSLLTIMNDKSVIITVQNGIGIEEMLTSVVAPYQIVSSVCAIKSTRIAPGHICHEFGNRVDLGYYDNGDKFLIDSILSDLQEASIDANLPKDIFYIKWIKLSFTISTFALSVISNTSTQELLSNHLDQLLIIGAEVGKIAEIFGYHIDVQKLFEDSINKLQYLPPVYPSIVFDYRNNIPMELDTTFGNILSIARTYDVSVPNIQGAYDTLKILERKRLARTLSTSLVTAI